jgi:hypothetical protein
MSDGAGMTGVAELQELLLATDTLQEFLDEVAGPRRHGSVAGPVVWGDGAVGRAATDHRQQRRLRQQARPVAVPARGSRPPLRARRASPGSTARTGGSVSDEP